MPRPVFGSCIAHFARPDAWAVHAEAGPTLAALAGHGCRIGLASNFDGRLRGVAAGLPELESVSTLIISSEVGWRKPAAAFFQAVGHAAGTTLEKIVFVGDDPVNDYDGAARPVCPRCCTTHRGRAGTRRCGALRVSAPSWTASDPQSFSSRLRRIKVS